MEDIKLEKIEYKESANADLSKATVSEETAQKMFQHAAKTLNMSYRDVMFYGYKVWKTKRSQNHPIMASVKHITDKNSRLVWDSNRNATFYNESARGDVIELWQRQAQKDNQRDAINAEKMAINPEAFAEEQRTGVEE